jgi:hypothetical protein
MTELGCPLIKDGGQKNGGIDGVAKQRSEKHNGGKKAGLTWH